MTTAQQAIERLKQGNARYVANASESGPQEFTGTVQPQLPFAVILGCSDSRVPVELVFDEGPGELFVIRVAGNVVAPTQIASVEFAVEQFGSPLVVVLGHSHCGAVKATLSDIKQPLASRSQHIQSVVERIRPSIEHLAAVTDQDEDSVLQMAVRANIQRSVENLTAQSGLLRESVEQGQLTIVGAEYDLGTGTVAFLH